MRMLCRSIALAILSAVLSACTPRAVAETIALDDQVVRTAGLAYGEDPRQTLDVYRARQTRRSAPVVIFLYGGRWKYSSKRDYLLIGNALARRGWIAVLPDYRLYPEATFPAWVVDGASAVRWTRDHIARYGGDSTCIIVVGHSSSAHTVAMLALDERYLRAAGVPSGTIRGFASMAGPVDTTWTAPDVQALMGPSDEWPASYPSNFVDGSNAPLLLLHGASDNVVSVGNSVRLANRITSRGGCAKLVVYPGIGHVKIALAIVIPSIAPTLRDIATFVDDPAGYACGR
jgi:acetyl esterase/lipase